MSTSLLNGLADNACVMHLIRHGATPPNLVVPPIIQGAGINEPLAPIGREQAACAGRALARTPLAAVYSSPLLRAMETAEAIAAPHGLAVVPVEGLKEVEVGRWEGLDWDVIQRDFPDEYHHFRTDPATNGYPGGETLQGLLARVKSAIEQLLVEHVGEQIAVVAHSVVNRVYMGDLMGLPLNRAYPIRQDNCGINVVRWREGRGKAITVNGVQHLHAASAA